MAWQKGIAQTIMVTCYADGVPTAPTGALTATISKDGGAFGAIGGSVAQVGATPCALLSLSAEDMTCDTGVVRIVDGGGAAEDRYVEFATEAGYTAARAGYLDKLNIGGETVAHTGNADSFKADVSGLATQGSVDAVAERTDRLPDAPASTGDEMALSGEAVESVADQVWDEVLAGHEVAGSAGAALAAASPAGGAYPVAITVTDEDDEVIEGVSVTVRAVGGGVELTRVTDLLGQAGFGLDAGEYGITIRTGLEYDPDNPYPLTVEGETEVTCEVARRDVPAPEDPDYCLVWAAVQAEDGSVPGDAAFRVEALRGPEATGEGKTVVYGASSADVDAETGIAMLTVLRGALVDLALVSAYGTRYKRAVTIPDEETANWEDLE